MTPYDFAMEEVTLAIVRVADALIANEPFTIAQESEDARRVYRDIRELYPKLQLRATERDSLLRQMSLLGSQLNQWTRSSSDPSPLQGRLATTEPLAAIHLPHFCHSIEQEQAATRRPEQSAAAGDGPLLHDDRAHRPRS